LGTRPSAHRGTRYKGGAVNRGPRSLWTQQYEKKKFAAKSNAKSGPNGN